MDQNTQTYETPVVTTDVLEEGAGRIQLGDTATFYMHMKGSKYTTDPSVLSMLYPECHYPDSETYFGISHQWLYEEILHNLDRFGLKVVKTHICLSSGQPKRRPDDWGDMPKWLRKWVGYGARAFVVWELELTAPVGGTQVRLFMAMQNALDGSGRTIIALGTKLFCCDNLCMTGDMLFGHRHTKNIEVQLYAQIVSMVRKAETHFAQDVENAERLLDFTMPNDDALELIGEAVDVGVFRSLDQVRAARKHVRTQPFEELRFSDTHQTAWAVYNACTWGVAQNTNLTAAAATTNAVDAFFRKKYDLEHIEN